MMELIFEIGCEELPASFIEPALTQMQDAFLEQCSARRIDAAGLRLLATPRRLVLLVDELAETQKDLEEERTGPPAQVAFKDGVPTRAAEGFARGQGVDVADLYVVETDKGSYVGAKVFERGGKVVDLLPEILTAVVSGLHFPKSMRWAGRRETFARPVRWILAMADKKHVPMSFAGVESGLTTLGHRFAAPAAFAVESIADYLSGLEQAHVVVDPAVRRETINAQLVELGDEAGGRVLDDPPLVAEVANLVERPYGLLVRFSEDYLELPDEVLISSMRSHQRYFAIANPETGALLNSCAVIYNTPVRDPDVVRQGNLRVLKARLDDARFFWDKDLAVSSQEWLEALGNVVWLRNGGTMRDRCERMSGLAVAIAKALGLDAAAQDAAARAGLLAKTDLVTNMVNEFPDLQGVMGREYAIKSGEPEAVARAIHEQYLPRGADDDLPASDPGACVALAERLDALVGCFGLGLIPTSAADPYGLRRAALGILRILEARAYRIELSTLVDLSIDVYAELNPEVLGHGSREQLTATLLEFLGTRLKYQLAASFPTDVVDAVLAAGFDDVLSAHGRTQALATLRQEPDFEPLAVGFKRVVNILKKQADALEQGAALNPQHLIEPQEQALHEAYIAASLQVDAALTQRNWLAACQALIALKGPVDGFFDHVMVMTEDTALRDNRIALLNNLRELFLRVADISVL